MPTPAAASRFTVFTKPWPDLEVSQLIDLVADLGFDGVELPVRPGFQVEPTSAEAELPKVAQAFRDAGLEIASVASSLDESIFAACAEGAIPVIRIMAPVRRGEYLASEAALREQLAASLSLCERYGVTIGVQEHYGDFVSNAVGLRSLLAGFDPGRVGAVWDAAHDALAGLAPETGLEVVWDQLVMANLKNAYYERTNGPEADTAAWRCHFTTGPQGMASWPRAIAELVRRDYRGVICLTAEYDEPADVAALVRQDLAYARELLAQATEGKDLSHA